MKKNERDELLANLRAVRAEHATNLHQPEQSDEEEYVAALTDVADLLWEKAHGAPPLSSDPVAAMLGLVPDPERTLNGKALTRARKNARLTTSQLAERLASRGWDVQTRDVFRWENRSTSDVAPALIEAIADETGTATERLITNTARNTEHEALTAVRQTSTFQKLVDRWAKLQGVSQALAASALESRMLATVHRGDHPDSDQLLQSLEALVSAMERQGES